MPHPSVKKKFHLVTDPTITLRNISVGDLWYWNLGLQAAGPFLFNV
jgi:hypothetical protein